MRSVNVNIKKTLVLIELISDEDAASLMPEADDEELDVVIDAAIDRVLSSMA